MAACRLAIMLFESHQHCRDLMERVRTAENAVGIAAVERTQDRANDQKYARRKKKTKASSWSSAAANSGRGFVERSVGRIKIGNDLTDRHGRKN